MKSVQAILVVASLASLGFLSSPLWLRYLPDSLVYHHDIKEAKSVIMRIDEFNRANGTLPPDLCALGLQCDERAHLQYSINHGGYTLSFAVPTHGFFDMLRYDSVSGEWHVSD
jgi:hypothetical protein